MCAATSGVLRGRIVPELTPTAFLVALLLLAVAAAGVGAGLAWAAARPKSSGGELIEAALARLETARARDQLEALKLVEEVADYAGVVKRHRHRIDGAEGGRKKAENAAQPELPVDEPVSDEAAREMRRELVRRRFARR